MDLSTLAQLATIFSAFFALLTYLKIHKDKSESKKDVKQEEIQSKVLVTSFRTPKSSNTSRKNDQGFLSKLIDYGFYFCMTPIAGMVVIIPIVLIMHGIGVDTMAYKDLKVILIWVIGGLIVYNRAKVWLFLKSLFRA